MFTELLNEREEFKLNKIMRRLGMNRLNTKKQKINYTVRKCMIEGVARI